MTINVYDINDVVRITGTFRDIDGNLADPSTLSFDFNDPSGNTTTYNYGADAELVKSSTGVYYVDMTVDEQGDWHYKWSAAGTVNAVEQGQLKVKPDQV